LNHNKELKNRLNFILNYDKDLNNHWLAGFTDADASFQIKIIDRNNKIEVRLNFHQKKDNILLLIKDCGNIGYSKTQDNYYYGSTSFGSARNVINDKYHLLSSKHVNYLRKVYLIIQNHLNKNGIKRIIKIKNTMNNLNNTTV